MRARRGAALLGGTVAAGVLAVVSGSPAHGLPAICDSTAANVYHWVGGQSDVDWMNPANWRHGPDNALGAPNDNTSTSDSWTPGTNGDTQDTVACISGTGTLELDNDYTAYVWLRELHVEGAFTIHLKPVNSGLLVMGTATSTLGPQTLVDAEGTFGGAATVQTSGTVRVSSSPGFPGTLSSRKIGDPTYGFGPGTLDVQNGAFLDFSQGGTALRQDYSVELRGEAQVSGSAYVAADHGTAFDIASTGTLTLAGPGGYYQGVTGSTPSRLTNDGRLVKDGPGISIVDATYSQTTDGELVVESGTVGFPGGPSYAALVDPGATVSTDSCTPAGGAAGDCPLQRSAQGDPQSASYTAPTTDSGEVDLRETAVPATTVVGSDGIGRVVELHTAGLPASSLSTLELRIDTALAGSDLASLDVVREADDGIPTTLPDCLAGGTPPSGTVACVDRRGLVDSSRVVGRDAYLVVRTRANSRYIIRKELAVTPIPPPPPAPGATPAVPPPPVLTQLAAVGTAKPGKKLSLAVAYTQACQATVTAKLKVPGIRRLGYRTLTTALPAGVTTTVVLSPDSASKLRLRGVVVRRAKAVVTVACTDGAGQSSAVETRRFKLG